MENDRAICDGDALSAHAAEGASAAAAAAAGAGFVEVHVLAGSDEILGATIVASNAGDMISEITLAMQNKLGLGALGAVIRAAAGRCACGAGAGCARVRRGRCSVGGREGGCPQELAGVDCEAA